jgi:hypothetical protein
VQEEILVGEKERGLHPTDRWDLLSELDMACTSMDRINDERSTEARQLSQLVVGISDVLATWACYPFGAFPNTQSQPGRSCRQLISS